MCDVQERFATVVHAFPAVVHACAVLLKASSRLGIPVFVTEQYPKALGRTVAELKALLPEAAVVQEKTDFSMLVPGGSILDKLYGLPNVTQVILVGIEVRLGLGDDRPRGGACLQRAPARPLARVIDIRPALPTPPHHPPRWQAHVCVLQTAMDLTDAGYEVVVIADGVSSQRPADRSVALQVRAEALHTASRFSFSIRALFLNIVICPMLWWAQRMLASGVAVTTFESALFQLAGSAQHEHFKFLSALAKEPRPEPSPVGAALL